MSVCEFESLEKSLEAHLPEAELTQVKRILFGQGAGWVIARTSLTAFFRVSQHISIHTLIRVGQNKVNVLYVLISHNLQ